MQIKSVKLQEGRVIQILDGLNEVEHEKCYVYAHVRALFVPRIRQIVRGKVIARCKITSVLRLFYRNTLLVKRRIEIEEYSASDSVSVASGREAVMISAYS